MNELFRHINSKPEQSTRYQYAHHYELWYIEAMCYIYDSTEEDGHDKGAGLAEEVHYSRNSTGMFASYVDARGKARYNGERQKHMRRYEAKGYRQVVSAFRRNIYQQCHGSKTGHRDNPTGDSHTDPPCQPIADNPYGKCRQYSKCK